MENMLIALGTVTVFAVLLYGLALIWQDDYQRDKIDRELDKRFGDQV